MYIFTRQQRESLMKIYQRNHPKPEDGSSFYKRLWFRGYRAFRRQAFLSFGNCMMVPWANMIIGIETDGYTHS